ncbi:hypothetical protein [Amycolatopsis sp. NPDC003861]
MDHYDILPNRPRLARPEFVVPLAAAAAQFIAASRAIDSAETGIRQSDAASLLGQQ